MKGLAAVLFFLTSLVVCAQGDFSVPEDYRLDSVADYYTYEKDAVRCIAKFLSEPCPEIASQERDEAKVFGMLWLTGHPTLIVSVEPELMPFAEESEEALYIFLLAAGLHVYEHPEASQSEIHLAALRVLLKNAKDSKAIGKLSGIKKLRKLNRKGDLDDWVEENLAAIKS